MKRIALIAAGAALALTGGGVAAKSVKERGEERLAKMLEGRVAGEPSDCITTMRGSGNALQVIDRVAVVYDAGETIWVARPLDPRMLDADDVLVIDRFSPSRLCTIETMRTVDRNNGFFTGNLRLEDFVPYTKAG